MYLWQAILVQEKQEKKKQSTESESLQHDNDPHHTNHFTKLWLKPKKCFGVSESKKAAKHP